jgi:hypothetical protein
VRASVGFVKKQLKRTNVCILSHKPRTLSLTSTVPLRCGGKSWKKPRRPGRARACHFSPPACHRCRSPGRVAASTTSLACSRQRPGRRRWRCPGLAAYLLRAAGSRRPVDPRWCPGPPPWLGSDDARGTRVRESSPASKGTSGCALPRTSVLSYRTGARARSALACETDRRGRQALSRSITRPRVISGRIRVVILRELLRLRQRRWLHSSPSTFDRLSRLRGVSDVCG